MALLGLFVGKLWGSRNDILKTLLFSNTKINKLFPTGIFFVWAAHSSPKMTEHVRYQDPVERTRCYLRDYIE